MKFKSETPEGRNPTFIYNDILVFVDERDLIETFGQEQERGLEGNIYTCKCSWSILYSVDSLAATLAEIEGLLSRIYRLPFEISAWLL